MSVSVIKAGLCDTIQDMGRSGYAASGINPSGAMDTLAMQVANALTSNPLQTAVVEMHFPAPILQFDAPAIVALSGADFNAVIQTIDGNSIELPINKTATLQPGSKLLFKNKIFGERCYLSVNGGFNLPQWLGSYSTNLKIKEGGFKGRTLSKGDQLFLNQKLSSKQFNTRVFPWTANMQNWYTDANTFNFLPGPEWDWLEPASKKHFLQNQFTIAAHSDRMGIALESVLLHTNSKDQLVSSGVTYGTIQLLPNGKMIILAADHPTTGGYSRIANIIAAHLPKLAQASPGTKIRLLKTTIENAEDLLIQMQNELLQLQQAVKFAKVSGGW
ncbi:5-oxoprolinase subunit PxpC [soil metagenome]